MKKSTIWILAAIMAFAFFGLIYLQIDYIRESNQMRTDHFNEAVKRSLSDVSKELELSQTKNLLYEESKRYEQKIAAERKKPTIIQQYSSSQEVTSGGYQYQFSLSIEQQVEPGTIDDQGNTSLFQSPNKNRKGGNAITRASSDIQDDYIKRHGHLRDVIDEVLSKSLEAPNTKPIEERVDLRGLKNILEQEFSRNQIPIAFYYEVVDKNDMPIYRYGNFKGSEESYTQILLPNDPKDKWTYLKVYFPDKYSYIYQETSYLIPAVIFTFILLVTFIIIISIIFRQKRLSEMKNDFMNNMTHELKTPVSTISLAAQMLKDGNIMKSPEVFKHISGVINDETERLSFQVEKVLQMSLFEKQKATLKFKDLEMNDIVASVANTFQIKVEKFGGHIDIDLQATEDLIKADKMHITNVLFNLLDNAVKYRREDIPLQLMIRTWNTGSKLNISVEDNGIGMKKDDTKKIFDRFYRISTGNRHDVKGFGLGLAYVKKIVLDHGGAIKADSEYGVGTKFRISLPVSKQE